MSFQPGTSNRTALRIVKETVFGTTPATPLLKNLRYTGESISFNQRSVTSDEIRSDRMTSDLVRVGADVSGDINVELSFLSFDDLIEGAFASTFSAPVSGDSTIKNGVVLSSFTIQKHFQDLAVPIFQNFPGCRVGGMSLDFKSGSLLTGSFSVMGLSANNNTAQIVGATFASPGDGEEIFNAVTNLVEIKKDGVTMATKIKSMTLDLNNNLRGQEAIGTLGNVGIALGRLEIMGDIELYFENSTEYTTFLNATDFELSFKLLDSAGNYYLFTLPRVKYEEGTINAGQIDQDLMVNGKWRALYDSATACMIQLDRHEEP
jgi:Phage tail tube protein